MLNGSKYFDTVHGRIELEFFMNMANELDKYVK